MLNGASPLLASRRIADDPKAVFRAVRGLVLAVFLGTIAGGLVPTLDSLAATPNSTALSDVLLDTFAQMEPPGPANPAYTRSLSALPLQAVLAGEQRRHAGAARTYLATHAPPQVSPAPGAAPLRHGRSVRPSR